MKKFIMCVVLLMVVGCSTEKDIIREYNEGKGSFIESEQRKIAPKTIIKNDTLYTEEKYGKKFKPWKFDMYDSIDKSLENQTNIGSYGYEGQKINKKIYSYEHKDGINVIYFISKDRKQKSDLLYTNSLYHNRKSNKYSDVLGIKNPVELKSKISMEESINKFELESLKRFNINAITLKKEPNQFFGITTEGDRLKTLKIEGKEPDEISDFKYNGTTYYFWCYTDLKTNKEIFDYSIEYKDKAEGF